MISEASGRARAIGLALFATVGILLARGAGADDKETEPRREDQSESPAGEVTAPVEEASDASSSAAPTEDVQGQLAAGSGVRVKLICTNCNAASLSVNGMSGEHVRVSMDGLPTVSGLGTVYAISQFPADFIGHTKVTHGPGSVLTGSTAIGGTIQMHTIPRTTERKAMLEFGVADDAYSYLKLGGAERWGPVGALVWAQAARQQNIDANRDSWQEVGEFERVTAQGIFDFHLTDNQVITLDLSSYGEDQVQGPGGPEFVPSLGGYTKKDEAAYFNWRTATLKWKLNRPSGLQVSFGGRYSRRAQQQWTPPVVGQPDTWTFLIEDEQSLFRTDVEMPLGKGILAAGAAWSSMNLQVRQRFVVPSDDGTSPFFIVDALEQEELWLEYSRGLGSKWDFTAGLRRDGYSVFGRTVSVIRFPPPPTTLRKSDPPVHYDHLAPRASVHYRPNPKIVLGLAVGAGSQGPAPAFAETCCGARYQRSLQLRPEEAWSYQATFDVHPTPDQRVSLRLFRTDFDDFQTKAVYKSEAYVAYYTRKNIPSARIQGIDLVHDMRFKDDKFNVGWTWTIASSRASEILATNDLNEIITDGGGPFVVSPEGADVPFTPKHAGSAYFRYNDLRRGTSINFNWSYQGSLKHFELFTNRDRTEPWSFLSSQAYWTADVDVEQRIGSKGWSAIGGIRNLNDKVQDDFGDLNRIYDWGPLQRRTVFAGMKFVR